MEIVVERGTRYLGVTLDIRRRVITALSTCRRVRSRGAKLEALEPDHGRLPMTFDFTTPNAVIEEFDTLSEITMA